jgi:TIR domain
MCRKFTRKAEVKACAIARGYQVDAHSNQPDWWETTASSGVREATTDAASGRDVFISHSSRDAAVAREVCVALETVSLRCWIAPRDITPGQTWSSAIVAGLDGSRVLVLIFSRHADASTEVLREVERASSTGKRIVTLRIESVTPSGGLVYFLSATQWLDAVRRPLRPSLEQLVTGLHVLLKTELPARTSSEPPPEVPEVDLDHLGRSVGRKGGWLERLLRDR